jgi:hypothetical protein
MPRRIITYIATGILLAAVVLIGVFRPDRAAKVATGLTAHNLCSAIFVAGLNPDATFNEQVRTILQGPTSRLIHFTVDRDGRTVEASFIGLVRARARFTPGYGCRLDYPDNIPAPPPRPAAPALAPDAFARPVPISPSDPRIAAAMDRVFAEDRVQPIKNVKAVVIVKDNRVVAERYAPGFGIDTPLLSYSVAKSFTNAFLGILVR